MSNAHRIAWIDAQVRAGRYPNASSIAGRFEISRRQAARDVEYLRHSMGAPMEWCPDRNGYRYSDAAFALPAVLVSEQERSALAYLAERYAGMDDDAAVATAAVLRRLSSRGVVDPVLRPPVLAFDDREVSVVASVREAVDERRKIRCRYRGADGVVVTRTLHPYAIVPVYGTLTCLAYCDEVGERRTFPLARFESVQMTRDAFEVPAFLREGGWSRGARPLEPSPFVAVVRLDEPSDAERIERCVAQQDGSYQVEFQRSADIVSALLSCRGAFEVLSPAWLRSRVVQRLATLLDRHASH